MFVIYVVGKVLWWLRVVGGYVFGHLIVSICFVHKCGFALVMCMGRLRD